MIKTIAVLAFALAPACVAPDEPSARVAGEVAPAVEDPAEIGFPDEPWSDGADDDGGIDLGEVLDELVARSRELTADGASTPSPQLVRCPADFGNCRGASVSAKGLVR